MKLTKSKKPKILIPLRDLKTQHSSSASMIAEETRIFQRIHRKSYQHRSIQVNINLNNKIIRTFNNQLRILKHNIKISINTYFIPNQANIYYP